VSKFSQVALAIICLCVIGTFLVYTEHYGWAWIPFLISCNIGYIEGVSDE